MEEQELNVRKAPSEINNLPKIPTYAFKFENKEGVVQKLNNTRSNNYIVFENLKNSTIVIWCNQKFRKLFVVNCQNCLIQAIDSCVIETQECEIVNCSSCRIAFEYVDCKNIRFYNCLDCKVHLGDDGPLIETFKITWTNCEDSVIERTRTKPGINPNEAPYIPFDTLASYTIPDTNGRRIECRLKDGKDLEMKVDSSGPTAEDVLEQIKDAFANNVIFENIPKEEKDNMYLEELREYEDDEETIKERAKQVAEALKKASHAVVYTGAGVSTSAKIPDYRGPQGAWSVRDYGTQQTGKKKQLDEASPTYTHYALTELAKRGYIKFLISTNLDGLHLRSGFPTELISEMHGNCYKEICYPCDKMYLRSFNVLKTRTDRWTHLTGRFCTECGAELKDTIAHFTENIYKKEYENSEQHARKADVSLILGTSMFVQPAASLPYKTLDLEGGKIFLVNLQRTPIDHLSTKIYSETDRFMRLVMQNLGIEVFDTSYDLRDLLEEREKAKIIEENRKEKWKMASAILLLGLAASAVGYWKFKKQN